MNIVNKKAFHDYTILDRIEAGVSLLGFEVKSLRQGHGKLDGAFVRIIQGQMYVVNAEILPYAFSQPHGYDPKRTRRLLVHKKELVSLKTKIEGAKLTLIPLSWYTKGPRIKMEIGLARGKKTYEKREKQRKEDLDRELEQELRGK